MDNELLSGTRSFLFHALKELPRALGANSEVKKLTGRGAFNNLAFGAALCAQTLERMPMGDSETLKRLLLANKTIMALDEAIEQSDQLGEEKATQIINEVKKWWTKDTDKIDIHPVIDVLVSSMKRELTMQIAYTHNGTIPSMKEYLDAVVPSNGIQLIAAAYASVSTEAAFVQRQRFKDEVWNANLELRIRADWMKHTKDAAQGHLDLFTVAANEFPGMNRQSVEAKLRESTRPTIHLEPDSEWYTSIFLREYTKNAAQFMGKATPILHLTHPPDGRNPYST